MSAKPSARSARQKAKDDAERALLAEAIALINPPWRTMESAPRCGREFIGCWRDDLGTWCHEWAYWNGTEFINRHGAQYYAEHQIVGWMERPALPGKARID